MKLTNLISDLMFSVSFVKPDNPVIEFYIDGNKCKPESFTANTKSNKVEVHLKRN